MDGRKAEDVPRLAPEQDPPGIWRGRRPSLSTDATLQIGTNKLYGAIHQFGGTIEPKAYPALVFRIDGKLCFARKVTIPARPYLGVSAEDRAEIPLLVQDVLDAIP